MNQASREDSAGPLGWRNWVAFLKREAGGRALARNECALYSDSQVLGELRELGPYSVLNTASGGPAVQTGNSMLALILRVEQYAAFSPQLDPGASTATRSNYHGGGLDDEIAALLSLVLGFRCRSGGLTRFWRDDVDPMGAPIEGQHRPPYLPAPASGEQPMLPYIARGVHLDQGRELLASYPRLPPKVASAVVRAARLYQSAVWIADAEPNQAWLQLVGALEAASVVSSDDRRPHIDRIADAWPELAEMLNKVEPEHRDKLAKLLAAQVKSTNRVSEFVSEHLPTAPKNRPPRATEQVQRWEEEMPNIVRTVYKQRSDALHAGEPFPAPMCLPPVALSGGLAETGAGSPFFATLDRTWSPDEIPIMLHAFAYVVRGCVLHWWASLAEGDVPVPATW